MSVDVRDSFFEVIAKKATEDPHFIIITCDMEVFALKKFQEDFPERFINVGVAEQNAINLAAGLASTGKKVLILGILSFLIVSFILSLIYNNYYILSTHFTVLLLCQKQTIVLLTTGKRYHIPDASKMVPFR